MAEGYVVKTEVFEGPLGLLLSLIEKRKLLINDISLAKVADDYMAYVENLTRYPVGDVANFILVASTLVLIKSKSLLPTLKLTEEETGSIEDLQQRLREYQQICKLTRYVRERFGQQIIFTREQSKVVDPVFSPDTSVTTLGIAQAIRAIISGLPKQKKIPDATVKKIISLEDVVENLSERIRSVISVSFREFSGFGKAEKGNIVVSFLAMLELVRQGAILVSQESNFDDIHMESIRVETPYYQ